MSAHRRAFRPQRVKEKLTSNQLARYIKQRPRAQITQAEIDYAEKVLLDAEKRDTAAKAAAPFTTPVKVTNVQSIGTLSTYKLSLRDKLRAEISAYKAAHNNKIPDQTTIDNMRDALKQEIKAEAFRETLQKYEQNLNRTATGDEVDALIAKHENTFKGFGLKQSRIIKHKQEFDKYAIDKKQLQKNILALKYIKNANNHATFKPIQISDQLKKLVERHVMKGEKVDESD